MSFLSIDYLPGVRDHPHIVHCNVHLVVSDYSNIVAEGHSMFEVTKRLFGALKHRGPMINNASGWVDTSALLTTK